MAGECAAGDGNRSACNNKVIGARWYNASAAGSRPGEFASPRDCNSHGSHTASTAAGNTHRREHQRFVHRPGQRHGARRPVGHLQGALARRGHRCGQRHRVDIVDAIDDAVADGVDVINYSISGSTTSIVDPVDIAFLQAVCGWCVRGRVRGQRRAGGLDRRAQLSRGRPPSRAGTHDAGYAKTVTLGNGASLQGVGVGPAVPTVAADRLGQLRAGNVPAANGDAVPDGTLDPAKVTGKIVLCQRGVNARVDKSLAVKDAGGVGHDPVQPGTERPQRRRSTRCRRSTSTTAEGSDQGVRGYRGRDGVARGLTAEAAAGTRRGAVLVRRAGHLAGGGDLLKPDITGAGRRRRGGGSAASNPANSNHDLRAARRWRARTSPASRH